MELTIDQALQKAIGAHKAGQVQEADRLYTAILKVQPKHPDANHNLGVLAVSVGKTNEALPFLKAALEANPSIAQFWLSYIDVLIKLGRIADAKAVLAQAKSEGAKDEGFDRLDERIKEAGEEPVGKISKVQEQPQAQINELVNLYSQGQLAQALNQANTLIKQFPNSANLFNIQGAVMKALGQLDLSVDAYNKALSIKPDYAEAYNNMGATLRDQGELDEAIEAYNKALSIKPDYADAYNNMGVTLKEQGKLDEAIDAYNKALAIKTDYAEAYYNMGNGLQEQGEQDEAIEAYNKALFIKPDYAEAYNNMGNALQRQGKLDEAIEAYNKALAIKPEYAEAIENSQSLTVQLLPIIANYKNDLDASGAETNSEITLRPKYQIQYAIKAYLEGDFIQADTHFNNFKACDQNFLVRLPPKDKVFCNAYSKFIGRLLDTTWDEKPDNNNKVYHLGESHCLSYAHRNIAIDGSNFRIAPRITFGAKAFHFCRTKHDSFKAITKAHFVSLPKHSKVFLSYGEIDCRPNEGFISAARKLDKPLEELIDQTTKGYVQWFLEQNAGQRHQLYFINVPAPVYDKRLTTDSNSEVASTVALFNAALKKYSLQHGFDTVDVFKFTAGKEGFSNGLFHIDNYHLGVKALPEIEKQLS